MRLPSVAHRCTRLMRPFPTLALLLALLAPAGGSAASREQVRDGEAVAAPPVFSPATDPALGPGPAPPVETVPAVPGSAAPPAASAADSGAPALNIPEGGLALAPFLDYLLDPTGTLDITRVSAPERASDFRPYEARTLFRQTGTLWLRFRLAPLSSSGPAAAGSSRTRLDLGGQVPGIPAVWTRVDANPPVPAEAGDGLFSLAGLSGGGEVFARLDGLPGLWFAPALRTVSDALTTPERRVHPLLLAALAALLLLCLVRSITERGDGRLWAGVLTGAALLHALWGIPATPRGTVIPFDMPGLLAAGVALMLLPHVGRNIMRTRDTSPRLDTLLLVLALPGAALAVLPLLPGLAWTARLFSLWPLGAAVSLIPALTLLARGVPGSGLFSLACLGLVAGGGLALWGVNNTLAAPLWGLAPLAGVAFAALLLAAAAPRSTYSDPVGDTARTPSDARPALLPPDTVSLDAASLDAASLDATRALRLEEILRNPVDALLREACALDQILERPAENRPLSSQDARQARAHADNLVAAARELSSLVGDLPRLTQHRGQTRSRRQVFDLLKLVQSVFADVGDALSQGDLGLSWYIAPHLGRLYKGDRDRLRFVLAMLLADAARATDRGAVSLHVRRADMSPNPGHLQFTVADTGSGIPPLRRSSLALAKAWELAADHQGDLFVDSTPRGVEITFSLECVALADDGRTPRPVPPADLNDRRENGGVDPRLVILAASRPLARQMLAFFLEDQGQNIWEARDAEEAAALYAHTPAALVIFDGHLPEEDIVTAVAAIRVFEGERSLPAAPFLALALDEEQAERLHQAGCDHSLLLPVVRGEFRAMSLHLASPSGIKPRPSIVPRRVPPTRPRPSAKTTPPAAPADRPETPAFSPLELRPAEAPAASRDAAPARSETPPAAAPLPSPARPTDLPAAVERSAPEPARPTPPTAATGLNLPPAPKKRLGWLNRLFKPTPRITPSLPPDDADPGGSEWVGEPMPADRPAKPAPAISPSAASVPAASPASGAPDTPRAGTAQTSAAPLARAPAPELPPWYSPCGDDPECSVGEPMPMPRTRLPAETSAGSPGVAADASPPVSEAEADADSCALSAARSGQADALAAPAPVLAALAVRDAAPHGSPAPDDPPASPGLPAPAGGEAENAASVSPIMNSGDKTTPEPETPEPIVPAPGEEATAQTSVRPLAPDTQADTAPALATLPAAAPDPEPFPRTGPAATGAPVRAASAVSRARSGARPKRQKSRLDNLPFLSLDPNATSPHAAGAQAGSKPAARDRPLPLAATDESDDIMDLTEAEMVDSPLLKQVPDLLRSLDAAVEHAAGALDQRDPWGLINAADRMADRAAAFGLHALSDLALCLKETGQKRDFDTAAQLLPELRAEVERHRRV